LKYTFAILGYKRRGKMYVRGADGANYIPFSAEKVHLIRDKRDKRVPPINGVEVEDNPRFPTILYIFPGKLYHQLKVEEGYSYSILEIPEQEGN